MTNQSRMARPQDPRVKIELLKAAESVFVEHGLERAKIEEITARAGCSKGAFYLHFSSKEEAFRQIVEPLIAQLSRCVSEPFPTEPYTIRELFQTHLEQVVETFEFLWVNRGVMGLLMNGGGSMDFRFLIGEFEQQLQQEIQRWLHWGIAHKIYRNDLNTELISRVLAGAYDGLARWLIQQIRRPDLYDMVLEVERFTIRAIGTPMYIEHTDSVVNYRKTVRIV